MNLVGSIKYVVTLKIFFVFNKQIINMIQAKSHYPFCVVTFPCHIDLPWLFIKSPSQICFKIGTGTTICFTFWWSQKLIPQHKFNCMDPATHPVNHTPLYMSDSTSLNMKNNFHQWPSGYILEKRVFITTNNQSLNPCSCCYHKIVTFHYISHLIHALHFSVKLPSHKYE